jgi:hypothetical protein
MPLRTPLINQHRDQGGTKSNRLEKFKVKRKGKNIKVFRFDGLAPSKSRDPLYLYGGEVLPSKQIFLQT